MRKPWPFDITSVNEDDRADLVRTLEEAHAQGRQIFFEEPDVFGGIASDGREVRLSKRPDWGVTLSGDRPGAGAIATYSNSAKHIFELFLEFLADPVSCVERMEQKEYWPLPVLTPDEELTTEGRKQIAFLEHAFRRGFKSFIYHDFNFGAQSSDGREGLLILRGSRWLVDLFLGDIRVASKMVNDFAEGADFVLKWLVDHEVPEGFTLNVN